jgi:hypothetical protein
VPALRRSVRGAALAALVLPLAACRGDLGPPLSEWRSKADEICKSVQSEADLTRPVLFQPSLAQTLRRSAEFSRNEAQRLRDLDKPSEERDKVRDYLAALDERNRQLDLLASAAEHPGPDFAPPSLDPLTATTQDAAKLATELEMKHCRAGIDVSVGVDQASTTTTSLTVPGDEPAPDATDLDNETQDQAG